MKKKLIFINGPAGVGKTSVCKGLHSILSNSALLESEWCRYINPFIFNSEIESMTEKNMTCILRNYLECSLLNYVIFNWGLHYPRKQIFDNVMDNLNDITFELLPITLMCNKESHVERMIQDGRDQERIDRSIKSRDIYIGLTNLIIDTTKLSINETVNQILHKITN